MEYDANAHKMIISMSDIGNVLGLGYETRKSILKRKVFQLEHVLKGRSKEFAEFGKKMEPIALEWYEGYTGMKCTSLPTCRHRDNPSIGGTFDAIMEDNSIIEVKWKCFPQLRYARPFFFPDIPLKHYLQLQGYLDLFERDVGYLLCCSMENGLTITKVERDLYLWQYLCFPALNHFIYLWSKCLNFATDEERNKFINRYRMCDAEKKWNKQCVLHSLYIKANQSIFKDVNFDDYIKNKTKE